MCQSVTGPLECITEPVVKYKALVNGEGPFYVARHINRTGVRCESLYSWVSGHVLNAVPFSAPDNQSRRSTISGIHVFDTPSVAKAWLTHTHGRWPTHPSEERERSYSVISVVVWGYAIPFMWMSEKGWAVEFATALL